MTTRVITKELAVEEDLNLSKGTLTQSRGGQDLTLQGISISKVISDVSVFNNDTTANEFVDPNKYETVLVEGYSTLGDEGGGVFYFDPTIAPASADSGHIFVSGIVTVLGAWRRFTDDKIINVKHYGAVGDGVADDTAALLLAVTAVNTRVKAVLYFPEGTYNVNVSLNMTTADFVIVRGDGIQNTIINHTGTSGPLFLFDTGAEVDEASQFLMMMDFSVRTDQTDQTAIDITSTALVTDITRSAYITRVLFIGLTIADGWNFCIHSKDVRGITVKDCYARHVSGSVGTIFFNVDNTLAFVGDDYTSFNNETHFYENEFGATVPTGGFAIADGSITIAKLADATGGDIITFDAAGLPILLAIGTAGFVLTSNGAGFAPSWQVAGGGGAAATPDNYLTGLILSNAADLSHDIAITVGQANDSSNTVTLDLTSSLTKKIDATWVAGDNVGGLFSGLVSSNTTYHLFLIEKDSDNSIDVGFDTSLTAANIPAGYTEFRRIGSIKTNSSDNIINFTQLGDYFWLDVPIEDFNGNYSTSGISLTTSIPSGLKMIGIFMPLFITSAGNAVLLSDPDGPNNAPIVNAGPASIHAGSEGGSRAFANQVFVVTNTSGQIRQRGTTTSTGVIRTFGWIDTGRRI